MKNIITKNLYKKQSGLTLTDVVIAVIIIAIFTGTVATLMYNTYLQAVTIQKSANANAYATIILEKIDEKPYSSIIVGNPETANAFINGLISNGEIDIDTTNYNIDLKVSETQENKLKSVQLTIRYSVGNQNKEISYNKLKVKEKENV